MDMTKKVEMNTTAQENTDLVVKKEQAPAQTSASEKKEEKTKVKKTRKTNHCREDHDNKQLIVTKETSKPGTAAFNELMEKRKLYPDYKIVYRTIKSSDNRLSVKDLTSEKMEKFIMGFWENDDKIVVTTYAQFGVWCERHPGFAEKYEYIICDEPQNLVLFSKIGSKDKTDIPVHKIARAAICAAVNNRNVMVIAISATPAPLEELNCELKNIPIDRTDLRHYEEYNTIYYARPEDALNAVLLGQRGGLYVKHVQPMKQFAEILRGRGFNPLMIWSLDYKEPMNAEQLAARAYIIENEAVPEEYDVFLFNATAETSINIRSHMDFFIAHETGDTHITQSRGRYRGDLETLYVYDRNSSYAVVVPDEFLDRVLFREDLKELRARLDMVKNENGGDFSCDHMLRVFTDCGYTCENCYVKRRKAYIVRRKEQKSGEDPI